MKKIIMATLLMATLTACSYGNSAQEPPQYQDGAGTIMGDGTRNNNQDSFQNRDYTTSSDYTSGLNPREDYLADTIPMTETAVQTASWDLMVRHGQYHATSQGKVYPYGEVGTVPEDLEGDLWQHGKESMDKVGEDMKEVGEDFKEAVDKMLD